MAIAAMHASTVGQQASHNGIASGQIRDAGRTDDDQCAGDGAPRVRVEGSDDETEAEQGRAELRTPGCVAR